jgi:hypothetical protein
MNPQSQFVPLVGYEGLYVINKDQVIMSASRNYIDSKGRKCSVKGKVIVSRIDRAGYLTVKITNAKKHYGTQYVHRKMALTFLPNPFGKPFVNHINGNKLDNSLENLEWVTRSENHLHAIRTGLCKVPCKNKSKVIDMCSGKEYKSIAEASRLNDIEYPRLRRMLKNLEVNDTCMQLAA